MKQKYGFYLILVLGALTACSDALEEYIGDNNISLNVSVANIESATRAAKVDTYEGSVPTTLNKLKADVWFSNTLGEYKNDPVAPTYLPCRTQMEFDGTLQYAFETPVTQTNNLRYNTQNKATGDDVAPIYEPVYCVGLYPQGAWTTTDDKNATATIDGSKDLMFAKQIQGNWSEPLSGKTLEFEHQLTWLKICICATTQEASSAWGEVKEITVNSASTATVNLGTGNVTFSDNTSIPAFDSSSENYEELKDLHTTLKEVGSVCCSPTTEGSYTVTIQIGNKTISKSINLLKEDGITSYTGSTKGKLFILALYFNSYDMVEGVCTLTAWNEQNEDLYLQ